MNYSTDGNSLCEEIFRKRLDTFRCFLGYISVAMYKIEFGYICTFVLFLLAIISIFGKIKEHYRWFILNQVIWDILVSYKYICENHIGIPYYADRRCRFDLSYINQILTRIPSASYSSLLLLSFSRFLCLYFQHFYEKLTNGRRIFVTIFIYNFIMLSTNLESVFDVWRILRIKAIRINPDDHNATLPYDLTLKVVEVGFYVQSWTTLLKPTICLILSTFATIMIILKISKQFKFQIKNNKKDFLISLRIAAVITFQTFLYFLLFFVEGMYDIGWIFSRIGKSTSFNIPIWYGGEMGLSSEAVRQCFIQIRIFIESFIVLFIMSGYREAVIRFVKYGLKKFGFKFSGKSKTPVIHINNNGSQTSQSSRKSHISNKIE